MATNPYGQPETIDASNPYGQPEVKPSGALRKLVADKALGFASGAVGATKAIADAAGAGNKVSSVLADANTGINDYLSPEAKADQQEQVAIMADAQGKGAWEGIKAGAKAFAVAPVQTAVQGLGSVVPILAGSVLTGGAAPAAAVGAGIGVAMGAGTAKGAIFDDIKKRSLASGMNEADAISAATKAQEYAGANTDQIALGGALGAADALTGVSRIAGGMARGALRKPVADVLTNTAERGFVGRAAMGMAGEMPLEAAQGGQEQLAANIAAQRAGFQAETWDNVVSNATLEALASAGPGAAFGALERAPTPPVVPTAPPPEAAPADPTLQIGNTPDPYISFADGTVARQSEVDTYINALPADQQPAARAKIMGLAPQPGTPEPVPPATPPAQLGYNPLAGTPTVFPDGSVALNGEQEFARRYAPQKPSEVMGLDPAVGPLSAAAVTAVDTGVHQGIALNEANAADQVATSQAPPEQQTSDGHITVDAKGNPLTNPIMAAKAARDMSKATDTQWEPASLGERKFGIRQAGAQDGDTTSTEPGLAATGDVRSSDAGAGVADAGPVSADAGRSNTPPADAPVANSADAVAAGSGVADAVAPVSESNPDAGIPTSDTALAEQAPAAIKTVATAIDEAAHGAATSPNNDLPQPTEAQKIAGNYAKGHVKLNGLDLSIENPAGSVRSGKDKTGKAWKNTIQHHYGYIKGTMGNDKDHVDLFVKPETPLDYSGNVFVIDQIHPDTGKFDEHKVMVGFSNMLAAKAAYQSNYAKGWKGMQAMTSMPFEEFKTWVKDGPKNKPLAEAKPVVNESLTTEPVSQPQEQPSAKTPETQQAKPQQPAQAAKGVKKTGLHAKMEQARQARADYFTPGNIVASYGGNDEVLSYTAPDGKGEGWSVKVRAVVKQDGKWVPDPKDNRERSHSTLPDAKDAAKGPVDRGEPISSVATVPSKPKGGRNLRASAYDKNPMMTFLATHGLFHDKAAKNSHKSEFSPDKAIMVMGYGPVFKKTGKRLDVLTHTAIEEGYLPTDGTEAQLRELIRRAVAGEKISPMYAHGVAEQLAEQSFAEHLAQQQEAAQDESYDPFAPLDELGYANDDANQAGYSDITKYAQLEVDALLLQAEDAGVDVDQIKSDATAETETGTQDDYLSAAKQRLQTAIADRASDGNGGDIAQAGAERRGAAAVAAGNRGSSQDDARQAQSADQEGLTAPTRADVLAQQERGDNAAALDDKAQIDAEASRQTLTRQAAPEQRKDTSGDMFAMEKAQAEIDQRNAGVQAAKDPNQGGMFDEPAQEAVPQAKTTSADELRAKADLMNALADLGGIFNAPFKANMMPEQEQKLLPVLTRVLDAAFRLGYVKFRDAAKFALDQIRAALGAETADALTLEHLQGAYISMSSGKTGVDGIRAVSNIEAKSEIEQHTAQTDNERNGEPNVSSTDSRVERNRPESGTESAVGNPVSPELRGTDPATAEAGGRATGSPGRGQLDGIGLSSGGAIAAGERSDQRLPDSGGPAGLESVVAGADFREPGGDSGITGVPPEPIAASQVGAIADQRTPSVKATIERNRADRQAVKLADIASIRATLPQLLPGQQDDVKLAEDRFSKPDGYGMLFTNGTGTGKTFSGLGIIKRHTLQGKTNTLILAPDTKIASDWITAGKVLGLGIAELADTKDAGKGIVITTYANFGTNDQTAYRKWDLVVADEAHTLMQDKDGTPTTYLHNLRAITGHPDGAYQRHTMLNRADIDKAAGMRTQITANNSIINNDDTMDVMRDSVIRENTRLTAQADKLEAKLREKLDAIKDEVMASQGAARPRLVALSATPFAYEKTIDWANGYLFDYGEGQTGQNHASGSGSGHGYNSGDWREKYFMQHFGYSMRYNKLTRPDGKVDAGLMQRAWNGMLKKSGALSGRMLDVVPDYDRRFVTVDSAIGNRIDEAIEWLSEQRQAAPDGDMGFSNLAQAINDQFKYQAKRYLLEAIKADAIVPIVKQHLAMGRKVVVFHDYKKGGGFNPFRVTGSDSQLKAAIEAFNDKFKDLMNHPFADMDSPIEVFKRELPQALLINGNEKKSDLLKRYELFQDDASGPQVMLVQSAKNKGWSGHDTTGKHQRVLINLGQPTAPTLTIQQEGRIYRTGQASDAIMRYLNTGTNWERWTFASTIASRASTAENLGMGEMARALKDSFIQSFEESDTYAPGHEGEGKGGKERDKAANDAITEYDRAKTHYWATQKKNSRTKAQEGADYFATPEPLGLKMAQWLDARPGEATLEPSAGHGAIARWLPDVTQRTAIEPSLALRSRLALVMNPNEDRILNGTFEDHHITNKYDGIVMNPPFGTAGRTAVDHLTKAATHLRDGGRIVALLPDGPAANAKFDKWFYELSEKPVKPLITHPEHGPIYKGDTVTSRASFIPGASSGVAIDSIRDGVLQTKVASAGRAYLTAITPESITGVKPTGKRTEQFKPAEGLSLVASIKLPTITFERAGTAVATRIVVIEKGGANVMQGDRDYSDITDIKELFDKLENLDFAARTKPVEVAPTESVKEEKPATAAKPAKENASAGGEVVIGGTKYEIEIYTTNAGKEKHGVWMASKAEASKYSARAFTSNAEKDKANKGKWFVDEYWFPKDAEVIKPDAMPAFSRGTRPGASVGEVTQVVEDLLAQFAHKPPVRILDSAVGVLPGASYDDLISGAVHRGRVHIFIDQIPNRAAAVRTLFHELLHYGLRRFLTKDQYKAQMLALYSKDMWIRAKANKWLASEQGQSVLELGDKEYARARGVDEALAELAESNMGEAQANAFGNRVYRAVVDWLAKSANQFGFAEAGAYLSGITSTEARDYVRGVFGKLKDDAEATQDDWAFTADPAFKAAPEALDNLRPLEGLSVAKVNGIVNAIKSRWSNAPDIVVAANMADAIIPQSVRDYDQKQKSLGATGEPEGFVYQGKVYLLSQQLATPSDAIRVLFHEALGHMGLRGTFGTELKPILQQIATMRKADVMAKAGQYGLDMGIESDRLQAAEEVLAEMAEKYPDHGFVKRAIALIRAWLRQSVPGFGGMKLTDSDIIVQFILPARRFIEGDGGPKGSKNMEVSGTSSTEPAFSRGLGESLTSGINNVRDVKLPAGYLVGDLINAVPGKLNRWHKTVGTQYNLAQRSKPFKRVFDSVQNFLNDVSLFATEAADLAPNILPKLESWKDIGKSPLSPADTKAISAPIFEGTLSWTRDADGKPVKAQGDGAAGVVWTNAELKSLFNLTDKQIPLYREFRAATNKSLTNLAVADMLRFGGDDVAPIRDIVLASKNVTEAAATLRDYLTSLAEADPARSDALLDTAKKMVAKGDKAADLMARGYAPLSRFGQYTLDVVDADGERAYFGMFENRFDAAKMRRKMEGLYPQATITQGTVSEQEYKMFAGVSPETLELFGDMLGLEATGDGAANEAFQTYLKLAKSSRSAMKRLIQRKGIAGFNEDAGRVLAGFIYSNARQTASSLHMGEMTKAATDKDAFKNQGELQDAAVKLVDYIKNPQEEAQAFRGLLFAQYIGGSIASAMVNMTQPLTMTFPWLTQFGGVTAAAKQMAAAVKDANKPKTGDAKLDAALHRAEEDGTVSPQEVHQLMQQAQGRGALQSGDGTTAGNAMATANNLLSRITLAWGKPFSWAEQFNRRVTFIAAYRTAVAQGMADPDGFARRTISETQGTYNKGNKPTWARGAWGGVLFTFKQYSISYVEMLSRMAKNGPEGKKAALLALGVLFLMSGAGGMPGADDLDDLISGALQSMGYNFDSKSKRQEFFVSLFGEGGAQFMERGVSGLPGVPIDVSGRMGLGNLIPGTGLFTTKTDHTRDVVEFAGPGGDLIKRGFDAAGKLITGDIGGKSGALATIAPKAAQNMYQALDMANMGMYRDAKGMKVLDTDGYDAVAKAIGFQPNDVKRSQDASFEVQRMIGLNRITESEIANRWALGLFEKDQAKVQAARDDLAEWNRANPESPIRIKFGQVAQRVKKMNETKSQRIAKTAPKEIRAAVRAELAAAR